MKRLKDILNGREVGVEPLGRRMLAVSARDKRIPHGPFMLRTRARLVQALTVGLEEIHMLVRKCP